MASQLIDKFKTLFPKHAALDDIEIKIIIQSMIEKLQAKPAADDDDDDDNDVALVRTKSQPAPSQAELIVNAMSPEARELFLREFSQKAPDLSACHADEISSDPGPHGDHESFMNDDVTSSR